MTEKQNEEKDRDRKDNEGHTVQKHYPTKGRRRIMKGEKEYHYKKKI